MLFACSVLASSCGGGGDDSVSVDDYANDLCTALRDWSEELRGRQAELQEAAAPDASSEESRAALQRFVDGAAAATNGLAEAIEDAGVPDTDGGAEVADAFQSAIDDTNGELEEARGEVAELPTGSASEYRAAVDGFVTDLRSSLEGFGEHFEDVDAPELETALEEAEACGP